MSYLIRGLPAKPFQFLFGLSEDDLKTHDAMRYVVDQPNAYPDRIEMRDAQPGETVILVNYEHLPTGPYRARHAVFVLENAQTQFEAIDTVPDVLARRLLSVRAFGASNMMIDADVTPGAELGAMAERFLGNSEVKFLHVHFARRGCYAARIERVQ